MENPNAFVTRYVEVWNEPSSVQRRQLIETLWSADGAHYSPSFAAEGWDEIEERITTAYDKWVDQERCLFFPVNNAQVHHGGIRFNWHMMRGDLIASVGFNFIILDTVERIKSDHQFVDPTPA